ncbi:MAG: hypothetical protein AAF907_14995, partial [Planctomycetota bacterium]
MVALLIAGLTWGASLTLRRYERTMDRLVRQFLQPEPLTVTAGFGGEARLGEVRARQRFASRSVALRCYAEQKPGYLRGRADYTLAVTIEGSRWVGRDEEMRQEQTRRSEDDGPLLATRRGEPADEDETTFLFDFRRPALDPAAGFVKEDEDAPFVAPPPIRGIEIWPAQNFRGAAFAPPNAVRFVGPEAIIESDEYGLTLTTAAAQPHYAAESSSDWPPALDESQAVRWNREPWNRIAAAVDPADPRLLAVPPL